MIESMLFERIKKKHSHFDMEAFVEKLDEEEEKGTTKE